MRKKTRQAILAHAAAVYPFECCGIIAQQSRQERYFPCRHRAQSSRVRQEVASILRVKVPS